MREGLETGCAVAAVVVDFGTDAAVLLMKAGIPRDLQVRAGCLKAAAQRRDSQGCRRGWNRQSSAAVALEAGRSGGCMFGFAAVDCVAVRNLGSVDAAEAAAETAAVQSVDAVGRGREEAAAIAIRTAVAAEQKSGMIVAVAVAAAVLAAEEEVRMLDMAAVAVVVAEDEDQEEDQEEEAGNTARLELAACRN